MGMHYAPYVSVFMCISMCVRKRERERERRWNLLSHYCVCWMKWRCRNEWHSEVKYCEIVQTSVTSDKEPSPPDCVPSDQNKYIKKSKFTNKVQKTTNQCWHLHSTEVA